MFILFISSLFAALATVSKSNNLTVISTSSTPNSFSDEAVHLDNFKYESSTVNAMNKSIHNNHLTRRNLPPFLFKLTDIPSEFNSDRINSGIYGAKVKLGPHQQELLLAIEITGKISWVKKVQFNVQGLAANDRNIPFRDNSVSGVFYTALLSFLGKSKMVQFRAGIIVADIFPNKIYDQVDGVLGLGYVPKEGRNPPNDNYRHIFDAGYKPIFSFYFGPIGSDTSHLIVGGFDSAFFQNQEPRYYNWEENPKARWLLKINYMIVNSHLVVPGDEKHTNHATFDTVSSRIIGPATEVAKIYSKISHSEAINPSRNSIIREFSIFCDEEVKLSFNFGDVDYEMDPNHMKLKESSETRCIGTISGYTHGKKSGWIFGTTFLRNVYTIFDIENNRIGFVSLYRSRIPIPFYKEPEPRPFSEENPEPRPFFKETPGFDDN